MPSLAFLRPFFAGLAATVVRFPLPLAGGLLYCVIDITELGYDDESRLKALAVLGFFWTLSARLFAESRGWGRVRELALAAAGLGFIALKLFADQPELHPNSETVLFLGPALVLLVMAAPFLSRAADTEAFWDFNRTSWLAAALAFLAATILGAGLSTGYWAIEELFGWELSGRTYNDTWTVVFALFCPWLALARVPRRFDAPDGAACPRALAVLIAYVLVPLAVGYLVIVYAYLVRILVLWELPRGQVAAIVSGYAAFGVATYLAAWPLRQSGPVHVRLFHRYFHYALAAPVVLLAVAVAERVSTYGVTETRYALGVLAVWLAVLTAALVWRRESRLTLLPLSLAVLMVAASFGPWGAAGVSLRSQTARLAALLTDAGLFAGDRIVPSTEADVMGPEGRREVVSILRYLRRTGRLDALDGWFEAGRIAPASEVDDALLAIAPNVDWKDRRPGSFRYSAAITMPSVAGYDWLLVPRIYPYSPESTGEATAADGVSLQWSWRWPGVFTVQVGAEEPEEFDLSGEVERLQERYGDDWPDATAPTDMSFDRRVGGFEMRLVVNRLGGYAYEGEPRVTQVDLALLLRRAPPAPPAPAVPAVPPG